MEVSLEKEYISMELHVPVEAKIGHTPVRATGYVPKKVADNQQDHCRRKNAMDNQQTFMEGPIREGHRQVVLDRPASA